ncbi:dihydrolipoamide S-succinyltransferase [Schizosaccharomyces japonicus yFS275]|uniref:dihydrolipoyllysine-residue succinyltransferase n=1 Tax=Schizosaccharomyces japonicus (strain yFS275 / FY16936) TaxID=402676 RepID=B6K3H9_SCHJY|nr:dihydrolipoamide S-succinyltransferase [Schizosaccharomyces japonicus yFS275]EEB08036.1 dihydrolipoamide S-succinyltransferase [Schizosaccharomyces japonicus yFS275]
MYSKFIARLPSQLVHKAVAKPGMLRGRSSAGVLLFKRLASIKVKTPQFPESISEGTLAQWIKKPGEHVEKDEEIASVETDKIDAPVIAPSAGLLKECLVEEGDTIGIDQDIAIIDDSAAGSASAQPEAAPKAEEPAAPVKEEVKPEPAAPKQQEAPAAPTPAPTPAPAAPRQEPAAPAAPAAPKSQPKVEASPAASAPSVAFSRKEERVKMNRMRLRIAERLKESQNRAASLTTFNECDMSAVIALRKKYKDEILKETGVKLGFMSFFTKACTQAAKTIPAVNGSIEGPNGGDTIVYRDYCDLSVAVATPKGLVTPVVRNAESLSLVEIERSIAELSSRARNGKLTIEDMAGGTFTISNGGVFGSLYGTPIINLPQTAVLGLHAIKERAVVVNGQVVPRPMMYLALTYDHRLVDGREAVTFLKLVKEFIEDPAKMLLA